MTTRKRGSDSLLFIRAITSGRIAGTLYILKNNKERIRCSGELEYQREDLGQLRTFFASFFQKEKTGTFFSFLGGNRPSPNSKECFQKGEKIFGSNSNRDQLELKQMSGCATQIPCILLGNQRGVVSSRVALLLRSAETKP